jgi:hypothetical protein
MTKHGKKRGKNENPGDRQSDIIHQTIVNILSVKGYTFETDYYVGFDVYGDRYSVHFFIRNLKNFENGLAVEIIVPRKRWNDRSWEVIRGNVKERIPCPVILVYPDEGLPPERLRFLKKNIDHKQLLHVFTVTEFLHFWESEEHPRRHPAGDRGRSWQDAGERTK